MSIRESSVSSTALIPRWRRIWKTKPLLDLRPLLVPLLARPIGALPSVRAILHRIFEMVLLGVVHEFIKLLLRHPCLSRLLLPYGELILRLVADVWVALYDDVRIVRIAEWIIRSIPAPRM